MSDASDRLDLANWRRHVANLYADVRAAPQPGRRIAWNEWRAGRNDLFRGHSQSPLSSAQRTHFQAPEYFAYDPSWRFMASVEPDRDGRRYHYQLGVDGEFSMKSIAWLSFNSAAGEGRLALYWIEGYGGGLFLPFKDATSGDLTYGGGRYLYDTIKGADLGAAVGEVVLDFNYAYNPSCAYNSRWVCPLAPAENVLSFPVTAGEKRFVVMGVPETQGQSGG
jgi:uncharacterized protein (DUF1684 family)